MKELLSKLQYAANHARQNKNEAAAHLFDSFFQEIERFEVAYSKLHERLKAVNSEREEDIDKLHKKDTNILDFLKHLLLQVEEGVIFISDDEPIINESAYKILKLPQNPSYHFLESILGFSFSKIEFEQKRFFKENLEISYLKISSGLLIIIKDFEEREKLKSLVGRDERLRKVGEMTTTIAHEIRNPLGSIRGYASLLERDLMDLPHLKEMAQHIIEGIKMMERVLLNLLHFARPIELHLEFVNLISLVKETVSLIKMDPSFPDEIEIELHLTEKELLAPIDKELIKTAVFNLLVNAFQAIQGRGKITVSIIRQNAISSISISDTGCGMDSKTRENLFSPFFTTKKEGNGIGLSEANKIIQAHFGTIDVRSELNVGSTFTINLPLKR